VVVSRASTVAQYLAALPADRRAEIERARDLVNGALPEGYVEGMASGMIGWVVPLERYADTYNGQPLVYAGLAAQKNYNALYLTCVYASPERAERLVAAFAAAGKKLDMGKSCIRFRSAGQLALDALRDEIASTGPEEFIRIHQKGRASRGC